MLYFKRGDANNAWFHAWKDAFESESPTHEWLDRVGDYPQHPRILRLIKCMTQEDAGARPDIVQVQDELELILQEAIVASDNTPGLE